MSSHFVLVALLLAAGVIDGRAESAAPAPTVPQPAAAPAATPPPLVQTTIVHGTLPDLSGRWLVLFDMEVNAVRRTMPFLIDITTKDGKPEIAEYFADLPKAMAAELEKHNADKTRWAPTSADLTTLAEHWADLPKSDRNVTQVTNDIWEQAAFDDAARQQMEIKNAVWVLRQTYAFVPGGQRPATQVNVFAAEKHEGSGWRGTAVVAQVAAAPFPIPITLNGTFRMLRIEVAPPATGLVARILDAFKGCGR